MTGCSRTFCQWCKEEMIHRDHRKFYESASALGQIIWREGPVALSVTDLDVVSRKGTRDGRQLLRLIEQKQPGHRLDVAQERTLRLLDDVIVHAATCEHARSLAVDPRSGVYVVRGLIAAATNGRQATTFLGDQIIARMLTGGHLTVSNHEELFRFLDPEDLRRRCRVTPLSA